MDQDLNYSIRVYKQYFNFASSHFLVFEDGTREPLHGHNYRVEVKGSVGELAADMVFDFLDIKPIVREICDSLDHKLLLPQSNPDISIEERDKSYYVQTPDESEFLFPKQDVLLLPLHNTSAERLAIYIATKIREVVYKNFQFTFKELEVEVEETPGQCAIYKLDKRSL